MGPRSAWRRRFIAIGIAAAAILVGFSCGGDKSTGPTIPPDPRVDVSKVRFEPVPAGRGAPQSSAALARSRADGPIASLPASHTEVEYLMRGEARTYAGFPSGTPSVDSTGHLYVTRILIRRPVEDANFSGRVFVEPFNTTSEADLDALWIRIAPLLEENGDAWIGVTGRSLGARKAKEFDPVRYAGLELPVNDYTWDILRQLGEVVKEGGERSPLGDLDVQHLYMGGYSQSGADAATFVSAFHPITRMADGSPVYDGYLPAAHAASLAKLQSGDCRVPGFEFTAMAPADVPVVDFETQSDVEGYDFAFLGFVFYESAGGAHVRRDDSDAPEDLFRLYELAGAPHLGKLADCDGRGSSFPVPHFLRAATELLFAWVEDGIAPPHAERIELEVADAVSTAAHDEYGNAIGGIRSPFVEVPLLDYDVHTEGGLMCPTVGNETPLPLPILARRHPSVEAYLEEFTRNLDATIGASFLREQDRTDILAGARAKAEEILGSERSHGAAVAVGWRR